jgi:hypothetical protein
MCYLLLGLILLEFDQCLDLYLFSFLIGVSRNEVSGSNGSALCISVYLTSLTPCTFNSWQIILSQIQTVLGICKLITILILNRVNLRLVTLKLIYAYIQVFNIFILTISSSLILFIRYSLFFFPPKMFHIMRIQTTSRDYHNTYLLV